MPESQDSRNLLGFLSLYLVLPLGILSTIFGYVESVYKLTGVAYPFLFASVGFLLVSTCLVWLIWFSDPALRSGSRKIALPSLVVACVLYYSFVQYYLLYSAKNDLWATVFDVTSDSAGGWVEQSPEAALARITTLMAKIGQRPDLLNARGRAHYELGRYQEAFQDFKLAGQRAPEDSRYVFNMAVTLRAMCDFVDAETKFNDYLKTNPDDVQAHYDRGVDYQYLGNYDGALADYGIVTAGARGRRVESALFNSGVAYASKFAGTKDPDMREQYLEKVIDYMDRSAKLGGKNRIAKIYEDLKPVQLRSPQLCERYSATDDLTPLQAVDQFQNWLRNESVSAQDGGSPRGSAGVEAGAPRGAPVVGPHSAIDAAKGLALGRSRP